jgi:hypothetical protein
MFGGWAVEVETAGEGTGDGRDNRQLYYARIGDRAGAEDAVRKEIGSSDVIVTARAEVSSATFDDLRIPVGRVTQAHELG